MLGSTGAESRDRPTLNWLTDWLLDRILITISKQGATMQALKETTDWATPNHTYLLDGTTLVAYIKQGTTEPFYFKNGIKHFDKRGRTFQAVDQKQFQKT
jgi:hypothetical protein